MANKVLFSESAARKVKTATQIVLSQPRNRTPGANGAVLNYVYLKKGKLDEALAVGGSADMSVWVWDGSAEADNEEVIEVFDWYGVAVPLGLKVIAAFISGRWYVIDPPTLLLGKTDAAIAKGASGTVSVWSGTPGSETDTTQNVTAYNRFANVAISKWVWLSNNGNGWYLTAAEC